MNPVTIIWSVVAASCLTLASMHLYIWIRDRRALANLAFAAAAIGVAGTAAGELALMNAASPAEFGFTLRWAYLAVALLATGLLGFEDGHRYFSFARRAGRIGKLGSWEI
jgi:hypothetical protein